MRKIFIYYSLTGNGDEVSSYLASRGYDVRKVVEKKKMPKSFFFSILAGGFRAGLNLKGKLINYNPDVNDYDEIVIGSPIWNGRFPPAINRVLSCTGLSNKKLTFLFYSGSGDGPKALKKVRKLYKEANIIFLKEPKKHPQEYEKIKEL